MHKLLENRKSSRVLSRIGKDMEFDNYNDTNTGNTRRILGKGENVNDFTFSYRSREDVDTAVSSALDELIVHQNV